MTRKKVLITGHAGLIGRALRESRLKDKYELSFLDKRRVEDVGSYIVDMGGEIDDILPAFEGKDVVVHLAADKNEDSPWESIFRNNIIPTVNAFEAAIRCGVGRVVFASSVRVTDMYQLEEIPKEFKGNWYDLWERFATRPPRLITPEDPTRPYNFYGASKAFGEDLGRFYSHRYGLSVICLRIGAFLEDNKPTNEFLRRVWISWRDGIDGFDKAISVENVKFGIFYLVSDNTEKIYDISRTIKVLGYSPQDNSEDVK